MLSATKFWGSCCSLCLYWTKCPPYYTVDWGVHNAGNSTLYCTDCMGQVTSHSAYWRVYSVCRGLEGCTPYMELSTFHTLCTMKTASWAFCGWWLWRTMGFASISLMGGAVSFCYLLQALCSLQYTLETASMTFCGWGLQRTIA